MTGLFVASLLIGLLLAVGVMLFGVERARSRAVAGGSHSVYASIPVVAGFAVVFGIVGYLVARVVSGTAAVLIAAGSGVAAALIVRWLVAKSASMEPEHDIDDERYVLQGHIARVVAAIDAGREGEISFDVSKTTRSLRARSVDDQPVAAGTEVVIERIEGNVAYVEPWLQVERRL
jgi:membrane protein implicated in regulation of membrane protease activity